MPIKTFYLKDAFATGSIYGSLQEDGSPPATATTTTGWTVGTTLSGRYSLLQYGTERAAATFGTTPLPVAGTDPDNAVGDAFRSEKPLTGRFRAGIWKIRVPVIAVTTGGTQDGLLRCVLWKHQSKTCATSPPQQPWPEPVQVSQTINSTTIATNLSTGTPIILAINVELPSVRFDSEFLYLQMAWQITGAGGSANCDVLIRVGADSFIQTPFFDDGEILYPTDAAAASSNFGNASETPPADALSTTTGWDMFNLGVPGVTSLFKHGTEKTTGSFSPTANHPQSAPDNSLADAIRSENTINTTFESGSWCVNLCFRAKTNPAAGANLPRMRYRLWKSPNADGSSATEITSGYQKTDIVSMAVTTTAANPSLIFHSTSIGSRVTFSNEYLFLQLAADMTGSATTSGSDAFINYGIETRIATPNMVIPQPRGHTLDQYTAALWRFNDNTDDEAGVTHLTSSAALSPEFVAGVDSNFSSSYAFSGSNYLTNTIATDLSAAFGNSNTIESWIYIDSHPASYSWVMHMGAAGESYTTNITGGYKIVSTGPGNVELQWEYGAGSDSNNFEFTGSAVPSKTWTHIALVREDLGTGFSDVTCYINAVYKGKAVNLRNPQGTSTTWTMGRWNGGSNGHSGRLDDTRISNVARSYAEIYESYYGYSPDSGNVIKMNSFWSGFSPGLRKGFN